MAIQDDDDNTVEISKLCTVHDNVSSIVLELDSAIHEVLETILSEAMACVNCISAVAHNCVIAL